MGLASRLVGTMCVWGGMHIRICMCVFVCTCVHAYTIQEGIITTQQSFHFKVTLCSDEVWGGAVSVDEAKDIVMSTIR